MLLDSERLVEPVEHDPVPHLGRHRLIVVLGALETLSNSAHSK